MFKLVVIPVLNQNFYLSVTCTGFVTTSNKQLHMKYNCYSKFVHKYPCQDTVLIRQVHTHPIDKYNF